MSGLARLRKLAGTMAERWRDRDYDERVYPDVVEAVLAEAGPLGLEPMELVGELSLALTLPRQTETPLGYGRWVATIYRDGRQVVDVHVTTEASFDLFRSYFVGGFLVVGGSFLHSEWELCEPRAVHSGFLLGELKRRRTDRLVPGARRPVPFADLFGQRILHLDGLGVIVVWKTEGVIRPRLSLLPPVAAISAMLRLPVARVQQELLLAAHRADAPGQRELLERFVDQADSESALLLLLELAVSGPRGADDAARLLERNAARFGHWPSRFAELVRTEGLRRSIGERFPRMSSDERLVAGAELEGVAVDDLGR